MSSKKRAYIRLPNRLASTTGFFGNFFCILSMIKESQELDAEPYVDFKNTAFCEGYNPYEDESYPKNSSNPWDWWFEQSRIESDQDLISVPQEYSMSLDQSRSLHRRSDLEVLKKIFKDNFTIKEKIIQEAEDYYKRFFEGRKILGVMARGAEKNYFEPQYGLHSTKLWIDETKRILRKKKDVDHIFLVTEEESTVEQFKRHFPDILFLDVFRRTNQDDEFIKNFPLWPCLDNSRHNHKKRLGEECIIQALLLSRCNYLLGKQCGTISAAVLFSNKIDEIYFSDTNPLLNKNLNLFSKLKIFLKRKVLRIF